MTAKSVRAWCSQAWETLRSALSWMHWRRRARENRLLELEMRLVRLEAQILRNQRSLLWEALQPVAQAAHRLDQCQQVNQQETHSLLKQQEELLMEVLNSLQPSAREQLLSLPAGRSKQAPSFPSSEL